MLLTALGLCTRASFGARSAERDSSFLPCCAATEQFFLHDEDYFL